MTLAAGAGTAYGSGRITAMADQIMEKVIDVFAVEGVPLPDRKLITVGEPVHDCEELVVVFVSLNRGIPGSEEEAQRCDAAVSATFQVHLVRCFPVSTGRGVVPPTSEELTDNAREKMVDSWLLARAGVEVAEDPLVTWGGIVQQVYADEPTGGYSAVIMTLQIVVP
jgi:hypothetical protein